MSSVLSDGWFRGYFAFWESEANAVDFLGNVVTGVEKRSEELAGFMTASSECQRGHYVELVHHPTFGACRNFEVSEEDAVRDFEWGSYMGDPYFAGPLLDGRISLVSFWEVCDDDGRIH